MTPQLLNTEEFVTELDISHLVIEDDTPVDNFQSEEQQRLLVEPLYSSKAIPQPFLVAAKVGLFYKIKGDPIVPDVMLSLGVQRPDDFSNLYLAPVRINQQKENKYHKMLQQSKGKY